MKVDFNMKEMAQNLPTHETPNFTHSKTNRAKKVAVKLKNGLRILPNLFTLGNAFFGFISIVCASSGEEYFLASAYFILFGAMKDSLDGRIARMTGNTSRMGLELDSLADATTFCLAPAFLCYEWQLKSLGIPGLVICAAFFLAGILRLARFNVSHSQQTQFFMGLPSTIAACFIASFVISVDPELFLVYFVPLLAIVILLLACAMISDISFPTFKHLSSKAYFIFLFIASAVSVAFGFSKVLLAIFLLYFLTPLFFTLFNKLNRDTKREGNS